MRKKSKLDQCKLSVSVALRQHGIIVQIRWICAFVCSTIHTASLTIQCHLKAFIKMGSHLNGIFIHSYALIGCICIPLDIGTYEVLIL